MSEISKTTPAHYLCVCVSVFFIFLFKCSATTMPWGDVRPVKNAIVAVMSRPDTELAAVLSDVLPKSWSVVWMSTEEDVASSRPGTGW